MVHVTVEPLYLKWLAYRLKRATGLGLAVIASAVLSEIFLDGLITRGKGKDTPNDYGNDQPRPIDIDVVQEIPAPPR